MTRGIRPAILASLLAATALTLVPIIAARQAGSAEMAFEAARKLEAIDRDLPRAIAAYQAIATRPSQADRPIAAAALLRLAALHALVGQATSARQAYERVLSEFSDQRQAVASARARLNAMSPATRVAARGDRAVWSGEDVDGFGTVSPDGRLLTYVDWGRTVNLMVRDLVAGTSRPLTPNATFGEFGEAETSAISRDGEWVAYHWWAPGDPELRVVSLRGSGMPTARTIRRFGPKERTMPFDWSPDGKSIAMLIERPDLSSMIALVAVADGAIRPLRSIDWRSAGEMAFSPDGRFVAYDLSSSDVPGRRAIRIMAIDGSQDRAVVDDGSENHLMGWSADGHVAYSSDRTGQHSLWIVKVHDGQVAASPRLVKEHIGSTWSVGLTPSGTLYVWRAGKEYVGVATLDPSGRAGSLVFQKYIDSRGWPAWSADGRHLVYISCGQLGAGGCRIFVKSEGTPEPREVRHAMNLVFFPQLSPDGTAIAAHGSDRKGHQGIYRIDVGTGETTRVMSSAETSWPRLPDWSKDGRVIRYQQPRGDGMVLLEHDLATGQAKEVFQTDMPNTSRMRVSPDGRHVGFVQWDPEDRPSSFFVAPMAGGPPVALLTAPDINLQRWHWTADSQSVFVLSDRAVLQLSLSGERRTLDLGMRIGAGFSVHPDGRSIAVVGAAGDQGYEIWALENFLPAADTQ